MYLIYKQNLDIMKKLLLILSFSVFAFGLFSQVNNYSVGDVVDDFTVTDTEGHVHNLYTYTAAGKYVYIDFFYSTCSYCQGVAPTYNEFYDKYGCNSGDIICLTINSGMDNNAAADAFEVTYGGSFNYAPAVSNEGGCLAVKNDFGIEYFPTICLIGPDNKLKNGDIWPVNGVNTFEATFPADFNPNPMACTTFANTLNTAEIVASIYPNPSYGTTFVQYNFDSNKTYTISVFNVLGKEVFAKIPNGINNTSVQLNTSSLNKGIYIIRILEEDTPVADLKLYVK